MYEALGMWLDDLNWTIINSNFQKKKTKEIAKLENSSVESINLRRYQHSLGILYQSSLN